MPINFGILAQPQAPGIQTQVVQSAPQQSGGQDDLASGIKGLLNGVFGRNSVSQANQAVSTSMSQTPLHTLAASLIPGMGQSSPQMQGTPQGLLSKPQALNSDTQGMTLQQLQQNRANMPRPGQPSTMYPSQTLPLIAKFEGYSSKPYWDVNAYRAGYGSDTTTLADGRVMPIRQGMTVTQEDSQRDFARRTQQFATHAATQVGIDNWHSLSDPAKAALTSVTYNYGSLPGNVVRAVQSGDVNRIANSVDSLSHHNNGVNAQRRRQEAEIIRNGVI